MAVSGMAGSPVTLTRGYSAFFEPTSWNVASSVTSGLSPVTLDYDRDGLVSSVYTAATPSTRLNIRRSAQTGLVTGTWWGATSGETGTTPWSETATWSTYGELATYLARPGPSSGSATPVYQLALVRDNAGRITQKTETLGGVATVSGYTYDAAGRLATETVDGVERGSWLYDPNGNRFTNSAGTPTGATYDNQDRLLTLGATSFTYTANGELATKVSGGQTTSYTYDLEGSLRSVSLPGGNAIAYTVDALGHRVRRVRTGTAASTRSYVWDGDRLVAELDAAGAVVSRFIHATQSHSPDLMVTSSGTFRFVKDHLGSIRLVVNVATGALAQRIDYDAWGNILTESPALAPGAIPFQPFGFAGGIQDREASLVRFGARDYDPQAGRWTTKDTWRFDAGDQNLFAYVAGDPVGRLDPSGHKAEGLQSRTPSDPSPNNTSSICKYQVDDIYCDPNSKYYDPAICRYNKCPPFIRNNCDAQAGREYSTCMQRVPAHEECARMARRGWLDCMRACPAVP